MDFTPLLLLLLQCGLCTPPPRQLVVNVTGLHQSKESTYSVIIKQGTQQHDYVTVNYSMTLKLRLK